MSSIILATCLTLVACNHETYNDCVLSSLDTAKSDLAIKTVKDACVRKFETDKSDELDAVVVTSRSVLGGNARPSLQVTNSTADIVTQFKIKDIKGSDWTYNTWIEPGRWVEVDLPTDNMVAGDTVKVGASFEAKSVKVIPSS